MSTTPILEVEGLRKVYHVRSGFGRHSEETVAVDDISFQVYPGECFAIVGESGSGKTTTLRMILGLESPTQGTVKMSGRVRKPGRRPRRAERLRRGREAQIVFQDPYSSFDPRQTIGGCIEEAIRLHFDMPSQEREERVAELLSQVGLDPAKADRYPRALSGGERQRVAIARALAAKPAVLVLDEPVSALDVSIQSQVLNLLADLREQTGVTFVFISHDLAVIRQISDRTAVLYQGRIVEHGPTEQILDAPEHPYTKRLLRASANPGRVRSSDD